MSKQVQHIYLPVSSWVSDGDDDCNGDGDDDGNGNGNGDDDTQQSRNQEKTAPETQIKILLTS